MTGAGSQVELPSTDYQRKMMPRDHLMGPSSGLTGQMIMTTTILTTLTTVRIILTL